MKQRFVRIGFACGVLMFCFSASVKGEIGLPFGPGETWTVCRGYNKLTHADAPALDFSIDPYSPTQNGCAPTTASSTASSDKTGHAEVVQVQYDPKEVSYEALLKTFWENHDPTTPNRQGPDVGTQYRSVIFFHTPEQEKLANKSKEEIKKSGKFKNPLITEIVPAGTFYRAEEYHQQYLEKRGLSTCHI